MPSAARRRRRAALTVGGVVLLLGASACTGSSGADHGNGGGSAKPEQLTWTAEQAIEGLRPGGVATDPVSGMTYVGGSLPASADSSYSGPLIKGGTRKPVLWARSTVGSWHEVPLKVRSFYGAQATLASISANGRLNALGAVAGGAHANPRPSFFVGDSTRVTEREQNFYVYGGENAVGIVSVAAGPSTLLMVGQWAPDGHRASGALWTSPDGGTYVRHDEIPGLGDSADGQRTTSPQAAAAVGDRFVVVGSVTDLSKPELSIVPAVWTSTGTAVTLGSLPTAAGRLGGPTAVACAAPSPPSGRCLTAGLVTERGTEVLAAWTVTVGETARGAPVDLNGCSAPPPAPDAGESVARPARVRVSVDANGDGWVVASTGRTGVACRVTRGTARPVTVPAGCIPVAVQSPAGPQAGSGRAELVCADARGVRTYRQS
ncbi:MAG: hypothetical protein ACJ71T_04825 [Actinomycetales bacterium]